MKSPLSLIKPALHSTFVLGQFNSCITAVLDKYNLIYQS